MSEPTQNTSPELPSEFYVGESPYTALQTEAVVIFLENCKERKEL
jgi:hypothetical protein